MSPGLLANSLAQEVSSNTVEATAATLFAAGSMGVEMTAALGSAAGSIGKNYFQLLPYLLLVAWV